MKSLVQGHSTTAPLIRKQRDLGEGPPTLGLKHDAVANYSDEISDTGHASFNTTDVAKYLKLGLRADRPEFLPTFFTIPKANWLRPPQHS
jgi:hypothetical protein